MKTLIHLPTTISTLAVWQGFYCSPKSEDRTINRGTTGVCV